MQPCRWDWARAKNVEWTEPENEGGICPFQHRRTIHPSLSFAPTCNKTVFKDDLAEVKWKMSVNESRLTLSPSRRTLTTSTTYLFRVGLLEEAGLHNCLRTLHPILYVEIKGISDVKTGCGVWVSLWTCFHHAIVFYPVCCIDMGSSLEGWSSNTAAEILVECFSGMTWLDHAEAPRATERTDLRSCGAVKPWGFRCYCTCVYLWTEGDNEGSRHFSHKCSLWLPQGSTTWHLFPQRRCVWKTGPFIRCFCADRV